jgi:hypothetical protein
MFCGVCVSRGGVFLVNNFLLNKIKHFGLGNRVAITIIQSASVVSMYVVVMKQGFKCLVADRIVSYPSRKSCSYHHYTKCLCRFHVVVMKQGFKCFMVKADCISYPSRKTVLCNAVVMILLKYYDC